MTNILTAAEGAVVLRCLVTDSAMLALLPGIDAYIEQATGHNWTSDSTIHALAKNAARMLLVMWYENPGMVNGVTSMSAGLSAALTQLEALALRYIEFGGLDGAGSISLVGVKAGDKVSTLVGISGVSGDQSAKFEGVISVADQIQQSSTDDLSGNLYRAYILPASAL